MTTFTHEISDSFTVSYLRYALSAANEPTPGFIRTATGGVRKFATRAEAEHAAAELVRTLKLPHFIFVNQTILRHDSF